jgi:hypothetical protein
MTVERKAITIRRYLATLYTTVSSLDFGSCKLQLSYRMSTSRESVDIGFDIVNQAGKCRTQVRLSIHGCSLVPLSRRIGHRLADLIGECVRKDSETWHCANCGKEAGGDP